MSGTDINPRFYNLGANEFPTPVLPGATNLTPPLVASYIYQQQIEQPTPVIKTPLPSVLPTVAPSPSASELPLASAVIAPPPPILKTKLPISLFQQP